MVAHAFSSSAQKEESDGALSLRPACSTKNSRTVRAMMMWDVLLYICCFYWLINKAISANGLTVKSGMKSEQRDRDRE